MSEDGSRPAPQKFKVLVNSAREGLVGHIIRASGPEAAALRALRTYSVGSATVALIEAIGGEAPE